MNSTAIQAYDPEVQRLALLEQYNAHDHILQWTAFNKKTNLSELVNYYPANWRLYELNLKFPESKFDIDFIHMDYEKDFCIVRVRLYIGDTYETSSRRAVAHKQGKISQLDKVETQCKARAARDMGISTELALDMDDTPAGQVIGSAVVVNEEAPIAEQDAMESSEAPRQLPQPSNVQPASVQPQPVPANVQPMRPKQQPAPQQESKILPGQFNALKSLYLRLNEEVPKDLGEWSYQQAAATITGLQAKLKQAS